MNAFEKVMMTLWSLGVAGALLITAGGHWRTAGFAVEAVVAGCFLLIGIDLYRYRD